MTVQWEDPNAVKMEPVPRNYAPHGRVGKHALEGGPCAREQFVEWLTGPVCDRAKTACARDEVAETSGHWQSFFHLRWAQC